MRLLIRDDRRRWAALAVVCLGQLMMVHRGSSNASLQISAALGVATLGTIATDRARALVDGGSGLPHALTAGYTLAWEIGALTVRPGSSSRSRSCAGPGDGRRSEARTAEALEAA